MDNASINQIIDNSYVTTNAQQSAIRMRVDSNDTITNPYFFKEHDSETYNSIPIKSDEVDEVNMSFTHAATSHLGDQINQNYVRYAENNIDSELRKANRTLRLRRTDVEKAKIEVKQAKNEYLIYKYYIRILIVTFLFAAVIASLYLAISAYEIDKDKHLYVYSGMGVVATIYVLIFYLYYRETWRRKKDDWEKLIFKPPVL
jgi:hypothetical protein